MNAARVRLQAAAATLLAGSVLSASSLPASVALPLAVLSAVTAGWWVLPAEGMDLPVAPAVDLGRRGR